MFGAFFLLILCRCVSFYFISPVANPHVFPQHARWFVCFWPFGDIFRVWNIENFHIFFFFVAPPTFMCFYWCMMLFFFSPFDAISSFISYFNILSFEIIFFHLHSIPMHGFFVFFSTLRKLFKNKVVFHRFYGYFYPNNIEIM